MNQVESRLETLEHTGTVTVEHEDGSTSEETITSYEQFLHITHVGIYAGDGKVVDASSSRGQVVYRNLFDSDKQVLFGRPQIQGEN